VPAFAIPAGTTLALTGNTQHPTIIVKPLDAELHLKTDPSSVCTGSPNNLTLSTASSLPTSADLNDPTVSSNSDYIGTQPTVTGAPSVIDGVIQ